MLETALRIRHNEQADWNPASLLTFGKLGRTANHSRFDGVEEPPLAELLNDPLTHRLMASDGVKERHLLLVIAEVQARLNGA